MKNQKKTGVTSVKIRQEVRLLREEIEDIFTRQVRCSGCGARLFDVDKHGNIIVKCSCGQYSRINVDDLR